LLAQYVCVRVTTNTGMDIALFDRDWHNALYYFALNADEQIYLRYGGRDETSAEAYLNYEALELALRLGLEQHAKAQAGDLPAKPRPKAMYPDEMPLLKDEVIDAGRCVECHLVGDYQLLEKERWGVLDKLTDMYAYPDIKRIGIEVDVPKGLVVKAASGAVADAGMLAGDLIADINGEPVLTFADLQHAYNKVSRKALSIEIGVKRGDARQALKISLPKEWWYTDLYFRYWTVEPQAYFTSKPLTAERRKALGLPEDGLAAEVVKVDPAAQVYNLHKLEVGDIITAINGVDRDDFTENLDIYIRLHVDSGDKFTARYLRNGEAHEMSVSTYREHFRKIDQ